MPRVDRRRKREIDHTCFTNILEEETLNGKGLF